MTLTENVKTHTAVLKTKTKDNHVGFRPLRAHLLYNCNILYSVMYWASDAGIGLKWQHFAWTNVWPILVLIPWHDVKEPHTLSIPMYIFVLGLSIAIICIKIMLVYFVNYMYGKLNYCLFVSAWLIICRSFIGKNSSLMCLNNSRVLFTIVNYYLCSFCVNHF